MAYARFDTPWGPYKVEKHTTDDGKNTVQWWVFFRPSCSNRFKWVTWYQDPTECVLWIAREVILNIRQERILNKIRPKDHLSKNVIEKLLAKRRKNKK